jgi:hypothetical protein
MIVRINNIECREYENTETYHIRKKQPNSYYRRKEIMINEEGWELCDGGIRKSSLLVSDSCFESEETAFTVAVLKINKKEPCVEMETVGSRLLDLTESECKDFMEVYQIANKKIENEKILLSDFC